MIVGRDSIEIRLDEIRLVGVVDSIAIDGKIIIESSKAEGASKREKIVSGYDDLSISVNLLLIPDTDSIAAQIEFLQTLFEHSQQGIPIEHRIEQEYINAVGIQDVYWTALSFSYAKDATVSVDLTFVEVGTQDRVSTQASPVRSNTGDRFIAPTEGQYKSLEKYS